MSTQEQRRRAIGTALTNNRNATGQALTQSRRDIHNNMVERRTGRAVVDDLNSLIVQPKPRKKLKTVEAVGSLPSQRGRGDYTPPKTGGAIESPLTEPDYLDREHYEPRVMLSSDGLLSFRCAPIKKIVMTDAGANPVELIFAEPREAPED